MNRISLFLIIAILTLLQVELFSQNYTVDVFEDELFSENFVSDMSQDTAGNIWFAGLKSMFVYDGDSFKEASIPGIFSGFKSVACAQDGTVWAGGLAGFSKMSNGAWEKIDVFGNYPTISDIVIDQEGNIWACDEDLGVAKFDGNEWTIFTETDNGTPLDRLTQLAFDNDGTLWVGSKDGIFNYDGDNWEVIDDLTNIGVGVFTGSVWVWKIRASPDGKVWFAISDGGVVWYDEGTWARAKFIYGANEGPSSSNEVLAVDQSGKVWCDHGGYIGLLFNHDGSNVSGPAFNPNPWVGFYYPTDIFVDNDNKIWVASAGDYDIMPQIQRINQPPIINNIEDWSIDIQQLHISPNPAKESFNISIESPLHTSAQINMYDLNGRSVFYCQHYFFKGNNNFPINIPHLQNGIYLVKVTAEDKNWIGKIILDKT